MGGASSVRHGHVLKKVGARILAIAEPPVLQFGALVGVVSCPVEGHTAAMPHSCLQSDVWAHSSNRVRLRDFENESMVSHMDFGQYFSGILKDEVTFEDLRLEWYLLNRDSRPCVFRPTAAGLMPRLPPDLPPSSFSVFVPYVE